MNPLFLITKGVKARKKRLAAGGGGSGGGGGGGLLGTKITAVNSKLTVPTTHATMQLDIYDVTNNAQYTDPTTNATIRRTAVDDFVASSLGTIILEI